MSFLLHLKRRLPTIWWLCYINVFCLWWLKSGWNTIECLSIFWYWRLWCEHISIKTCKLRIVQHVNISSGFLITRCFACHSGFLWAEAKIQCLSQHHFHSMYLVFVQTSRFKCCYRLNNSINLLNYRHFADEQKFASVYLRGLIGQFDMHVVFWIKKKRITLNKKS